MNTIPEIRRFSQGDRIYVQAQQIWIILVSFVSTPLRRPNHPKTITYGEVAELMGYPDRRAGHMLSRQLGIVGNYCLMNDLPALNSIVVNQLTGDPGGDVVLGQGNSVAQEQNAVLRLNWLSVGVPTPGTLRKVWEQM